MQKIEECLTPNIDHHYDWFFTETGFTLWRCVLCKDVIEEYEDCQL